MLLLLLLLLLRLCQRDGEVISPLHLHQLPSRPNFYGPPVPSQTVTIFRAAKRLPH
jgi:hypothetical protein